MFKHLSCLAAIALLPASAQAAVTLLDFDHLRPASGKTYIYGPYQHAGYQLDASSCSTPAGTCFITTGTTMTSLDRTGAALVNFMGSSVTTVSRQDGGAFELLSIDLASNYGNQSGYGAEQLGVEFEFTFADGTAQKQSYVLLNTAGEWLTVNRLEFDLAPLTSFSWKPTTATSGFLQFDNISLAAPVPEAATWAMLIAGFGMVGVSMRRRAVIA